MHLVRINHCLFFINQNIAFLQIIIIARGAKNKIKKDGLITLKYIKVYMKIVFLWVLSWSAYPSLVRQYCSFRTSLSISLTTPSHFIDTDRREFSLNIRRMTVIGTYSLKLDTVYIILYVGVGGTIAAQ